MATERCREPTDRRRCTIKQRRAERDRNDGNSRSTISGVINEIKHGERYRITPPETVRQSRAATSKQQLTQPTSIFGGWLWIASLVFESSPFSRGCLFPSEAAVTSFRVSTTSSLKELSIHNLHKCTGNDMVNEMKREETRRNSLFRFSDVAQLLEMP